MPAVHAVQAPGLHENTYSAIGQDLVHQGENELHAEGAVHVIIT